MTFLAMLAIGVGSFWLGYGWCWVVHAPAVDDRNENDWI